MSNVLRSREITADFAVVGGGLAGLCAALAAARGGLRTVLVQDRSVLGGNASGEIRMHVVGADCHGHRPGTRETGLLEELRLDDAAHNPARSYSLWDLLLYGKASAEPNLTLLLDATCSGCETTDTPAGRAITAIRVDRPFTEESIRVTARAFADCSGDGRLGAEAGADFRHGREAAAEYDEPLAPPVADAHTLGSSILLCGRRHDRPVPFTAPDWARPFTADDLRHRRINAFEYGYWWFEWGGHLDTIRDNDRIRHECLRIALGVWDHVKNSGRFPEAAHWSLDWVGSIPGKRESRRFLGPHVLTQREVMGGATFPDVVAYGGWWVDLHPVRGIDAADEKACEQHHFPHLYQIPLRALHSRNVANLFFAGRNLSATHVAFASTRVMGTCALAGQAVGTAAAVLLARAPAGEPLAIAANSTAENLAALRRALQRADVYLPGHRLDDPADLAPAAAWTADSAREGAPPAAVADGVTRATRAAWGCGETDAAHHWASAAFPATLEGRWPAPRLVARIELVFCTGLERELMLTPSDRHAEKIVRGPQPETVSRYRLWLDDRLVAEVAGNHARLRIHTLDTPVAASRLRLECLATHGLDHARVFAVRAYGPASL